MVIEVTGMGWRLLSPPPQARCYHGGLLATGGAGVEHHEGASTRGRPPGPPPVRS